MNDTTKRIRVRVKVSLEEHALVDSTVLARNRTAKRVSAWDIIL